MKPAEVAKLLNLHDSTLRRYSLDYADYLSPSGAPGEGHHRDYTDRDVQVLSYILEMKTKRVSPENIAATLGSLKASNWARLPPLDKALESIVPTPGALIDAGHEKSAMQREIEVLREMLAEAKADRDSILARMHRAEALLELYQTGKLKPD